MSVVLRRAWGAHGAKDEGLAWTLSQPPTHRAAATAGSTQCLGKAPLGSRSHWLV